jgi:hypothetical protein
MIKLGGPGPPGFDGFNGQDGLIAEVFELKNVDFSYNATDGYTIYRALIPNICFGCDLDIQDERYY